jgi:hypothetical protein
MAGRLHLEMMVASVFRKCVIVVSLFISELLRLNVKLAFYIPPSRSVITYTFPVREFRYKSSFFKISSCRIRFSSSLAIPKAHTLERPLTNLGREAVLPAYAGKQLRQ